MTTNIKIKKEYLQHVILPLLLGGLIYVSFRDSGLHMFSWFKSLGIESIIFCLRNWTLHYQENLPDWIIYSLPDGLWTYSLATFMIFNWGKKLRKSNVIWFFIGPAIAIFFEIAQSFGLLKGTFDINDLIFCSIASILAFTHINFKKNENYEKRKVITC